MKDNWQYNRSAKPKETFETGGQDKIMEDRISSAFAAAKEQRGEGTTKIEISPTRQLNVTQRDDAPAETVFEWIIYCKQNERKGKTAPLNQGNEWGTRFVSRLLRARGWSTERRRWSDEVFVSIVFKRRTKLCIIYNDSGVFYFILLIRLFNALLANFSCLLGIENFPNLFVRKRS